MQIRARHWVVSLSLASALHAGALLALDFGGEGPTVVGGGGGVRISLGDGTGTLGGGEPGAGPLSLDADGAGRASTGSNPPAVSAAPPIPAAPIPAAKSEAPRVAAAPVVPEARPAETVAEPLLAAAVVPTADANPVVERARSPRLESAGAPASASDPISQSVSDSTGSADSAGAGSGDGSGNGGSGGNGPGGGGGRGGDGNALSDGSGQGGGEAGLAGLDPAYVRRFMASIERQKRYPRAARNQGLEGTALLWLRLDRSGRVLAYDVEESSGHVLLDRAVRRTIERADPLPPLPRSYPKAEVEILVPIAFRLR